jgi:hypothetical protein
MRKLLIALLLAGAVTLGGARPAQAHPWGWRGYWRGYYHPYGRGYWGAYRPWWGSSTVAGRKAAAPSPPTPLSRAWGRGENAASPPATV